jgi:VWFA-related protein
MIARFLDTEMGSRDSLAIASSKGQIGFLQQFTNNREVLRAALARVLPQPSEERTFGMSLPMSEFTAMQIETRSDRQNNVLAVYVDECLKQSGFLGGDRRTALNMRLNCERLVKSNARNILLNTGQATERTYQSLESLMRSAARLPGRKLVFFISDGFMGQGGPLGTSFSNKIKQITDAAQSANTVIYSIDARGLVSGTLDATNNLVPDANGRTAALAAAEILATQDALNALAEDTGGRALRNQNYFDRWVGNVLDETSNYYVLAWRPSTEVEKESKFRNIKLSVVGRPELSVRAPRGYIEQPQVEASKSSGEEKKKSADLSDVLLDAYVTNALPTALSLTHLNTPANGPLLTASFQIAGSSLDYGDGKQPATVTVVGVMLNDKGKIAGGFQTQLNVKPLTSEEPDSSGIIYNHRERLTPGIYQVRVAARDERSRRIGSAMQWIVIPDLSNRQLTLSSVLITGPVNDNTASKDAAPQVQLSADRRFSRSHQLEYLIFIYNAKRDAKGATNLTVETQVLRDGKVISTAQQKVIENSGDPERIPYAADLSLKSLAPGTYDLRVKIIDAVANTTAIKTTDFFVQ